MRRTFIGRMRSFDDGRPEARHLYAAADHDPDSGLPCGTAVAASTLDDLLRILVENGRIMGRPDFEPPKIVECPGRSGREPRIYEALSLDEGEQVRRRLRL